MSNALALLAADEDEDESQQTFGQKSQDIPSLLEEARNAPLSRPKTPAQLWKFFTDHVISAIRRGWKNPIDAPWTERGFLNFLENYEFYPGRLPKDFPRKNPYASQINEAFKDATGAVKERFELWRKKRAEMKNPYIDPYAAGIFKMPPAKKRIDDTRDESLIEEKNEFRTPKVISIAEDPRGHESQIGGSQDEPPIVKPKKRRLDFVDESLLRPPEPDIDEKHTEEETQEYTPYEPPDFPPPPPLPTEPIQREIQEAEKERDEEIQELKTQADNKLLAKTMAIVYEGVLKWLHLNLGGADPTPFQIATAFTLWATFLVAERSLKSPEKHAFEQIEKRISDKMAEMGEQAPLMTIESDLSTYFEGGKAIPTKRKNFKVSANLDNSEWADIAKDRARFFTSLFKKIPPEGFDGREITTQEWNAGGFTEEVREKIAPDRASQYIYFQKRQRKKRLGETFKAYVPIAPPEVIDRTPYWKRHKKAEEKVEEKKEEKEEKKAEKHTPPAAPPANINSLTQATPSTRKGWEMSLMAKKAKQPPGLVPSWFARWGQELKERSDKGDEASTLKLKVLMYAIIVGSATALRLAQAPTKWIQKALLRTLFSTLHGLKVIEDRPPQIGVRSVRGPSELLEKAEKENGLFFQRINSKAQKMIKKGEVEIYILFTQFIYVLAQDLFESLAKREKYAPFKEIIDKGNKTFAEAQAAKLSDEHIVEMGGRKLTDEDVKVHVTKDTTAALELARKYVKDFK
jgi:hypothetical protein